MELTVALLDVSLWRCNATSSRRAVILFDWDDTLLCSSFLQARSFRLDSDVYDLSRPLCASDSADVREQREIALQLRELESCVVTLLRQATSSSHRVHIVTNAERGWVELSASKFLPAVVPLLSHLTIISARSSFEHLFPDAPLKWKYFSMHSLLVDSGFFGHDGRAGVQKHVLSLGDSHVEREAVRAVCRGVPSTLTKSVKFAERPTIEQLRRQIELVNQCFGYIVGHEADLDLQLTVTVTDPVTNAANTQPTTDQTTINDEEMSANDVKEVGGVDDDTSDLDMRVKDKMIAEANRVVADAAVIEA